MAHLNIYFRKCLKTQRPVLVEAITERFKGHSISDPGFYRSKDLLKQIMVKDPLPGMESALVQAGVLTEDEIKAMDKEIREMIIEAMKFADKSPWPELITLGEDVFAPYKSAAFICCFSLGRFL